jgi:hypothetical protein
MNERMKSLRKLHEAMVIDQKARVLTDFMLEEFDGTAPSVFACIARMHFYAIIAGEPPMKPGEVDQALAIHKALVLKWLAESKKE